MSRSTPRKSRHGHNSSLSNTQSDLQPHAQHHRGQGHARNRSQHLAPNYGIPAVSDYESDAASYMAAHPPPSAATLAQRTNTELNLSVLQRYLPNISSILSIAANAVVYTLDLQSGTPGWEKAGIEGAMFVCAQRPNGPGMGLDEQWGGMDNGCVFILNRQGLSNLMLQLEDVEQFEVSGELLVFGISGAENPQPRGYDDSDDEADKANLAQRSAAPKVLGLWIHADADDTRTVNAGLIEQMVSASREARRQRQAMGQSRAAVGKGEVQVGPAVEAIGGRRLSLSDLFAGQK